MNRRTLMTATMILSVSFGLAQMAIAETPASDAKASLKKYFRAWGEPDSQTRETLLANAWAEKGTYTDPTAHVEGRDALVKHIAEFLSNPQFKNTSLMQTSDIDIHHRSFRFEWTMKDASGAAMVSGMDYGEMNEDGKITKIVGFFGPFPELK